MGNRRNAVILAAGKSKRFAPFTYEKPKGIFFVKGQRLIERQIEQLKEAGVDDIYIVLGFMKEKYFYLEEKYGVHLLVNNNFADKGNLLSMFVAKDILHNTFICCADQYFVNNPFIEESEHSYRACVYKKGKFREFKVEISNENIITDFSVGRDDAYCMVGHAYFTESFSKKFVELMEKEINDFGVDNLFWEEFYGRHYKELTLHAKIFEENEILEFDSVEELLMFDKDFLDNIDSNIVENICSVLKCMPKDIEGIKVIQKGLTNVSFLFYVNGVGYVYRHPGGTAGNLVDRKAEVYAQMKAKELGIDKSVIHIDETGWKLSYLVENLVPCNFANDEEQLKKAIGYIRKLHQTDFVTVKKFDTYKEAVKLLNIAAVTKGDLQNEFADLIAKASKLNDYIESDNWKKVLCHNDTYEPNYLVTKDGDMYLIDWEYTGVNDPISDLACILARDYFTDEEINHYLELYFERKLTDDEYRHCIGFIALCAFYWFCWGLYKGSVNDDDGFFMLPSYRSFLRFIDDALKMYEK